MYKSIIITNAIWLKYHLGLGDIHMKKKILIAVNEVEEKNRIVSSLSNDDYILFMASNKGDACKLLKEEDEIFVALIDMSDVKIDGYKILEYLKSDIKKKSIGVFAIRVNSGDEGKVLKCGANDFCLHDYNPEYLKIKLNNMIHLKENSYLVDSRRKDSLTGLYLRRTFLERVNKLVASKEEGYYVLSCFDIDKFKVINDLYGTKRGDEVLKSIARIFVNYFSNVGGICCRVNADNFAILYPSKLMDSEEIRSIFRKAKVIEGFLRSITFSVGRYVIEDKSLTPSAMYDRAMMAKATIKGRYDIHCANYDEGMRLRMLNEQEIVSEMNIALEDHQFEVWYQPQYNHETGALIGSEALVRWRHPKKGLIPPGVFIPIFEQNGFVYEIDKYVWEQCCKFLRELIDSGRNPMPISVNISRYDILQDGMSDYVTSLITKYDLEPELLRLEITESAFISSSLQIIEVVEQLKKKHFTVEIDDFGSGYSSLNILKDVPSDVLKLDMKFLEGTADSDKGGNIVASVVRMAKWIGMTIIAEGVETLYQADFLKSIGCFYIQGYLYSKPLPKDDFERVLANKVNENTMLKMEKVETYDVGAFWNPSSMETLIFNSFVGGACIFEYSNEKIDILRLNDKMVVILGGEELTESEILDKRLGDYIIEDDLIMAKKCMDKAISEQEEVNCEIGFENLDSYGSCKYLRVMMRVIAKSGDRYLFYCLAEDITERKMIQSEKENLSNKLETILDNMTSGVSAATFSNNSELNVVFANNLYFEQRGYTREEYYKEVNDPIEIIHPDDRKRHLEECQVGNKTKKAFSTIYRIIKRDGSVCYLDSSITYVSWENDGNILQIANTVDITKEMTMTREKTIIAKQLKMFMDYIGSGVCAVVLNGEKAELLFANDRYYDSMGFSKDQYNKEITNIYQNIYHEDRVKLMQNIEKIQNTTDSFTMEYRVIKYNGSLMWVRNTVYVTDYEMNDSKVRLCIFSCIDKEKAAEHEYIENKKKLEYYRNNYGEIPEYTGDIVHS